MLKFYIFLSVFYLANCSTVTLQQDLNYQGNIAFEQGNFQLSKTRFQQALDAARADQDRQYEAIAMFGLARSSGYLCEYEESEQWF